MRNKCRTPIQLAFQTNTMYLKKFFLSWIVVSKLLVFVLPHMAKAVQFEVLVRTLVVYYGEYWISTLFSPCELLLKVCVW